jgi:hypothetical protein
MPLPSMDVLDAMAEGWRRYTTSTKEDDIEKQDQPSPLGRSQRMINRSKTKSGGNDHEKNRSQRQREICKKSGQELARPHEHTV